MNLYAVLTKWGRVFFACILSFGITAINVIQTASASTIFKSGFESALSRPTNPLNDTGIDWGIGVFEKNNDCSGVNRTITEQDCSHGRDATNNDDSDGHAGFVFTKLDTSGIDLPGSAQAWSCVRDEVTDLVWEVKTNNGGMQDTDNTYSFYEPTAQDDADLGVKDGGNCKGSNCDTYSYVQVVNAQFLCGASDWRIPSREELRSIIDYSRRLPAIDLDFFPNEIGSSVWTGSRYYYPGYVWYMNLSYGNGNTNKASAAHRVRLARSSK